jgi:hypothetical protein
MKLKYKPKGLPIVAPSIDQQAEELDGISHEIKEKTKQLEQGKERFKALAERKGVKNGNERLMRGKEWEIGYRLSAPTPYLDYALVEKLVPRATMKKIQVFIPPTPARHDIDPQKFEHAVTSGLISKAIAMKCMVLPNTPPTKTFINRKIRK